VCFETFPHAITCALIQDDVPKAKLKRTQRARILGEHGVNTAALKSIDELDAALCALTAQALLAGKIRAYGDALGGYIVVPDLAPMHETNPE
jgi:predicted nuclease with RNAse H fold